MQRPRRILMQQKYPRTGRSEPSHGGTTPSGHIRLGTYRISEQTMTASHVGNVYGLTLASFTAYHPPGNQGSVDA
jgi:hypothetical protein